ncbi:oxidoreductase [Ophiobolus disseminans]|uniref:Oxidoreductase n=1 Tax=Ophiobolus disseminans TaxID=1469910 RepID=A0A6A7A4J8_9PLEO|nr:oxidoreductase [Ophiobolus disseminans]
MAASIVPTKTYHKSTYPSLDPTRPELSAKGKTIIITGGGTGIGAEAARYFAKAGASRVAILGRREQPLLDTKAAINAESPSTEILAIATDITKLDQVKSAFERVAGDGKIDVLCANAAVLGPVREIAASDSAEWLGAVTINLQGNFNVATEFLRHAAKDAAIIDTNSTAAHLDIAAAFSCYNVSKMAVARFYMSVQYEHPELSVFSIQPGAVATDMNKSAGYKPAKEGEDLEWKGVSKAADMLLGGYDDASLPASFMVWLASPEARFLKGKFLWANWDVEELKARKEEIEGTTLLSIGLQGWASG